MRFVETPVFTAELRGLLPEEQYQALQVALMLRPEQGPVIPGGGGLRKMRWGWAHRGKRGGLRVIYYWEPEGAAFYMLFIMLFIYAKNAQEELTAQQVRVLRQLVREEFR